jgi:GNAT superfamily N-acetyltransferase
MSTSQKTDNYKIRKFKKSDANLAAKLLCETFAKFNGKDATQEGLALFLRYNTPDEVLKLNKTGDIYVAETQSKIVGIIVGTNNNRVIRLYVDARHQGHGIASKLLQTLEMLYKKRGTNKMLLRASIYARNFYAALGYKKSTGQLTRFGINYQPMIKKL